MNQDSIDGGISPGKSCPDILLTMRISETQESTDPPACPSLPSEQVSLDFYTLDDVTSGQKCFGRKSDVERVLDSRCPCLQAKCLHIWGTVFFIVVISLIVVYFFRHHLKDLLEWLQNLDGWISGLLFLGMFTIVSFPMTWGYIFLNVAAGYLYGFLMGVTTVAISVLIGVTISLVVCRIFIRGFVKTKLQSEHLKAIIRVVESRRGFKVVFLTRLTPIPFGLQNGLFAITNMHISRCLLASFIGLLPTQVLNTYMGSSLRTMEDVVHHNSAGGYLLLSVQVGISAFLMWYVIRRARYELNKTCLPTDYDINDLIVLQTNHKYLSRVNSGRLSARQRDELKGDEREPAKQGHKRAHSASAILHALENKTSKPLEI